ncbi:MAG: hydrogenase nickel incorporation protein HypA/HybF [Thiomicrorhabdus sp.]|nr:MAG: hydrogenase nickel incorporation protein HypA/HybF [Thiomicrorhabdus sp.]
MHEYSIVQALIEQCELEALAHKATNIHKVVIKVGKLSGVEPYLLQLAFDSFKEISTFCQSAVLEMSIQPVEILCYGCGTVSELTEHHYVCPKCHSSDISVTDGKEMFLMQLEMV